MRTMNSTSAATTRRRSSAIAASLVMGAVLAATAPAAFGARPVAHGNMVISSPWVRVTPSATMMTAAYLNLRSVTQGDVLLRASVPASLARGAQLHRTIMSGMPGHEAGTMTMRQVSRIVIPRGTTVRLRPGDLHIMILGLRKPVTAGMKVPITLTFARSGTVTVTALGRES